MEAFEVWISSEYPRTFAPSCSNHEGVCERKIFLGLSLFRVDFACGSCKLRVDRWDVRIIL